jgi:hypothetical protein
MMAQAGMVTTNEPVFLYCSRLFFSPYVFTATGLDSDRDFIFWFFASTSMMLCLPVFFSTGWANAAFYAASA